LGHIIGLSIYVSILAASVIFGIYIGGLIWDKFGLANKKYGRIIGGFIGGLFLFPIACNLLGLG
jgi:hypothetical protein